MADIMAATRNADLSDMPSDFSETVPGPGCKFRHASRIRPSPGDGVSSLLNGDCHLDFVTDRVLDIRTGFFKRSPHRKLACSRHRPVMLVNSGAFMSMHMAR